MDSKQKALLLRQAALVSSSTGPFILLCMLSFAGVHINLWMVLTATFATFAILISGVMAAGRLGSSEAQAVVESDTIDGITTSASKKHAPIEPMKWTRKAAPTADIRIRPGQRKQSILGFGAALTGSSCKVFDRMPAPERDKVMRELFSPSEMNLNVCRVSLGSSDYHPELYSYCDTPDPTMKNFSIERDRAYILPTLKMAKRINPSMFLFGSPWSPPGWMKPNGTMLGGSMGNQYFPAYAKYFVRFLEEYEKEGIEIKALTVQNEVQADQGGHMPACTWTTELESEFVAKHLGPALSASDFDHVDIWMMDHNYDMEERAIATMSNPQLRNYSRSIAWHGYGGSAEAVSRVRAACPDSEHHFTEFNTFIDSPGYLTDWTFWGTQIGEAMNNWVRDYVMWNVALDEQGKPNIGPFSCGGVVTIHSKTARVLRSGGYWGLGHYSRYVKRGAWCVESSGKVDGLTHSAFINPDGSKVVVLANAGAARSITIEYAAPDGARSTTVAMEGDSVTTLTWR